MDQKILDGRNLVETYRADHAKLYNGEIISKDIPAAHTPLYEKLKKDLETLEYETPNDFFIASKLADDTEIAKLADKTKYERWE